MLDSEWALSSNSEPIKGAFKRLNTIEKRISELKYRTIENTIRGWREKKSTDLGNWNTGQ